MCFTRPIVASFVAIAAVCLMSGGPADSAEPREIPKISAFAPAADLIAQVDYFLARLEPSLASEEAFDLAARSRSLKDANTLSAMLLMLAVHDQKHALSDTAPAMLSAAGKLAISTENYQAAQAAFSELRDARQGQGPAGPPVKWTKVAALAPLMKQVPLVHTALKRGVEPNRLARQRTQSAAQSAALAAVAQASWLDVTHLAKADDVEPWRRCCLEMRDAAGEVNAAVHAGDNDRLTQGMQRLSESCDHCHARFRER